MHSTEIVTKDATTRGEEVHRRVAAGQYEDEEKDGLALRAGTRTISFLLLPEPGAVSNGYFGSHNDTYC